MPALVFPEEIATLKTQLRDCEIGNRFVLHCGDCVETFESCAQGVLGAKMKAYSEFRSVLSDILAVPILVIGRIAGQFFRATNEAYETVLSATGIPIKVPSYRGDIVNSFDSDSRDANPKRLVQAFDHSASVINFLRQKINNADGQIYTSHEGRILDYESALTQECSDGFANLSTHFLWLSEDALKPGSAHIEYFHGIQNPVGVTIGPNTSPIDVVEAMRKLNPENEAGKLVLIPRLGAGNVRARLPALVSAVVCSGLAHTWECDPMHGNTVTTIDGIKTRHYSDVRAELFDCIDVLREYGESLGGVHLETAYSEVTECLGGRKGVTEEDLFEKYETLGDPRLSLSQTHDLLTDLAQKLAGFSS